MQLNTIDTIVRRWLLENSLPIHYYAEALFHASAALRELTMCSLQVVNTKMLPLNEQNAADLPADYVDEVMVGLPVGDKFQPVPKHGTINPLRAATESGAYTTYTNINEENGDTLLTTPYATWYWNFNDYGEPTGRFFGVGGGAKMNGYQIFTQRRQIQFTDTFSAQAVLLMYISDGQSIDSASQVTPAAFSAIQSFISWKSSENRNRTQSAEAQTFYNERRLLRARKNDLTITDIKEILRKNVRASIKG